MAASFKKTGKGWKRLEMMAKPGHMNSVMKKHLKRATMMNGKLAEARVRDGIKMGAFVANRPLTAALKGGNEPLKGTGTAQLFNAITSKAIDENTVFVGVMRTDSFYNIAFVLHEGTVIEVTDAMRGLFFILWQASEGKIDPSKLTGRAKELFDIMPSGWKPLKPETQAIIIPSRPFIKQAFADGTFQKKAKANWQQAMAAAFKEMGKSP